MIHISRSQRQLSLNCMIEYLSEIVTRYEFTLIPLGATALLVVLVVTQASCQNIWNRLHNLRGSRSRSTYVESLYIYPIKSCRGVKVQHVRVVETGLEGDREYALALKRMVPSSESHDSGAQVYAHFTQYETRHLARFMTELDPLNPSQFTVSLLPEIMASVEAPASITLSFSPDTSLLPPPFHFHMHASAPTTAYDMGDRIAHFFSMNMPEDAIPPGAELRLLRKGPMPRPLTGCGRDYKGRSLALTNVLPLLVVSASSWTDVVEKLPQADKDMKIERFRGNIVLGGGTPWEEDVYAKMRIKSPTPDGHNFDFDVVGRCMRCHITTIDPGSSEKHASEPLKTMSRFRRIDAGAKSKVAFGMHAIPLSHPHILQVGSPVQITATTKRHFYIKGY